MDSVVKSRLAIIEGRQFDSTDENNTSIQHLRSRVSCLYKFTDNRNCKKKRNAKHELLVRLFCYILTVKFFF